MKVSKEFSVKKALILDQGKMAELNDELCQYCDKVTWEATSKNDADIEFDSFQELMQYDNFGDERIVRLTVEGRHNYERVIKIGFNPLGVSFWAYGKTMKCYLSADSTSTIKKLEDSIRRFAKKTIAPYWLFGKISFASALTAIAFIFFLYMFLTGSSLKPPSLNVFWIILSIFIGGAGAYGFLMLDKLICVLFPPVSFLWGEETKRNDRLAGQRKWFSGSFWAVVLGIIASLIYSKFLI